MTLFEKFISKADKMEQKALAFKDKGLGGFYHGIANWYYQKAYSLTVENAQLIID